MEDQCDNCARHIQDTYCWSCHSRSCRGHDAVERCACCWLLICSSCRSTSRTITRMIDGVRVSSELHWCFDCDTPDKYHKHTYPHGTTSALD